MRSSLLLCKVFPPAIWLAHGAESEAALVLIRLAARFRARRPLTRAVPRSRARAGGPRTGNYRVAARGGFIMEIVGIITDAGRCMVLGELTAFYRLAGPVHRERGMHG